MSSVPKTQAAAPCARSEYVASVRHRRYVFAPTCESDLPQGGTQPRPIAAVARDLGVHPETLRLWVRQDEADDGTRSDRLTTAEREELTALRREVRDLRRSTEQTRRRSPLQMLESYTQQAAREIVVPK